MKNAKIRVPVLLLCLCVALALLLAVAVALAADRDTLELSVAPKSGDIYAVGSDVTVKVTITPADGQTVAAGTVTFQVNEQAVSSADQTVSAGTVAGTPAEVSAEIQISKTNGFKMSASNTITATYTKDGAVGTPAATGTSAAFTVTAKQVTLKWGETSGLTYDGSDKTPNATVNGKIGTDDVSANVSITSGNATDGKAINAGSYTATAELTGDDMAYYSVTENTTSFTIDRADITPDQVTAPEAKEGLTFTGDKLALVDAGSCPAGTVMQYSLTNGDDWSDSIPNGTAAAEYKVYWKVLGKDNYKDYTPSADNPVGVTIGKAGSTTTGTDVASVTYGEAITLKAEVKKADLLMSAAAEQDEVAFTLNGEPLGSATVTYSDGDTHAAGSAELTLSPGSNADAYRKFIIGANTVKAEYGGSVNLNGSSDDTITVTMQAKALTYTTAVTDRDWNGSATVQVKLTPSNLVSGDEGQVGLTAVGAAPESKAGTYNKVNLSSIQKTGLRSDYYTVGETANEVDASYTINRVAATVTAPTVEAGPLTYNGSPQNLLQSNGSTNDGTIQYSTTSASDGFAATAPTGTEAKEYTIWYKVEPDENHTYTEGAKPLGPVTISAATIDFTSSPANAEYTGSSLGGEVTVTQTEDSSPKITPDKYNISFKQSGSSATPTDVGTYEVWVTITDNNFRFAGGGTEKKVGDFTIDRAPSSGEAPTATNPIYNGRNQALVTGGSATNGTLQYSLEQGGVYTDDVPQGKDAKQYTVYWKVKGDKNHSDFAGGSVGVTIGQKEVGLTWKLDDGDVFTTTYNGKPHNVTATATTGVAEESVNVTVDNGTQTNARDEAYTATASGLTDVESADVARNYKLPTNGTRQQTYTIQKSVVTFTELNGETTYDTKPHQVTLDNTVSGGAPKLQDTDYTVHYAAGGQDFSTGAENETKAGEYDVWVKLTETAFENYEFKDHKQEGQVGKLTVKQAELELTVDPVTITYGQKLGDVGVAGAAKIKDIQTPITGTWAWETEDSGKYPAVSDSGKAQYTVKFTPDMQYQGNFVDSSLSKTDVQIAVNQKELHPIVTEGSVQGKEYDGGTTATGGTLTFSDTLTGEPYTNNMPTLRGDIAFTDKNVGENKTVEVTNIDFASNGDNYTLNGVTSLTRQATTARITKKAVTLAWSGHEDLIYSGEQKNVTATISEGKVETDDLSVTVSGGDQVKAGIDYTATAELAGADKDNYEISNAAQKYTIAKSVVTFEEHNAAITYDTKPHQVTLTNTVTGGAEALQATDYDVHYAPAGSGSSAAGDTQETRAGTYDVWVKLHGDVFTNYEFEDKAQEERVGALTVDPATLELTVPAITIIYGDKLANTQLNNSAANIQGSDTPITGTWTWELTADTYPAVSDSRNTQYTVKFTPDTPYQGNFVETSLQTTVPITVNKAKLTPGIATVESKAQFDGKTDTTGTLTLTGAVRGESPAATGTFYFDDPAAGEDKTVTVTDIKLTDNWGDNYELSATELKSVANTGARIGKRTVDLSWEMDRDSEAADFTTVYNGEPVSVTAKVTNPVAGYDVTVDVTDGGKTNAGTYTATAALSDPINYALPTDGTQRQKYTISPAAVSFEIGGEVKDAWAEKGENNADPNPDGYTVADSGLSMTYDSYTHTVNVTQTAGGVAIPKGGFTVTYKKQGDDAAELTELRDAGTYDVYVNLRPVEGSTYNFAFDGQEAAAHSLKLGTIEIKPYAVTAVWTHTDYVYHGHKMHPVIIVQNVFGNDGAWDATGGLPTDFNAQSPQEYQGTLFAFAETDAGAVGTYDTVTARLYGKNADNYEITNAVGTVNIVAAPVTFTVADNIWVVGDTRDKNVTLRPAWGEVTAAPDPDMAADHQYPAAGTEVSEALETTIEYRKNGEAVEGPTEAGTYEVWVKIGNENFYHAATGSGEFHNVGELVIAKSGEEVKTYTVTFDPNGGQDGPARITGVLSGQTVVLPGVSGVNPGEGPDGAGTPYELKRDGYIFLGWSCDGRTYRPNEEFHMPAADVTFTARWLEKEQTHCVNGTVMQYTDANESGSAALNGATVTLKQGAETLAETMTGEDGGFTFEDLAPGVYNLVIRCGGGSEIVKTYMVTIADTDVTGTYTLPSGALNTVVEVGPGVTAVVDLDAITGESEIYTNEDKKTVEDGGAVAFDMKVEMAEPTPDQVEKLPVSSGRIGMTLDLTLTKTVTPKTGSETEQTIRPIHDSKTLITTLIHLPAELQGKTRYTIYRFHSDGATGEEEMQTITTGKNRSGEYLEIVRDGTAIEIHARLYSTYVLTWYQGSGGSLTPRAAATVETGSVTNGSVTVSDENAKAGDAVTVTPKADEGYAVDRVTVTDKNGKAVAVSDNGDGVYSFVMPEKAAQPVTVTVTFKPDEGEKDCPSERFTDVDRSAWYHEGVDYAVESGLMEGVAANAFAPDAATTRAMVVTILYRLEGEPAVTKTVKFSDVPAGQWYSDAIRWAAAREIVGGYGNGKFGPNDAVTREQMAAILYRYAAFKGYDVTGAADLSSYTDAGKVSGWAAAAMRWAVAEKLIEGTSTTTLSPTGDSTRAQAATILTRLGKGVVK